MTRCTRHLSVLLISSGDVGRKATYPSPLPVVMTSRAWRLSVNPETKDSRVVSLVNAEFSASL